MTLSPRLATIKSQADWHRETAGNHWAIAENLQKSQYQQGKSISRDELDKALRAYYKHRCIADDLAWAFDMLSEFLGHEKLNLLASPPPSEEAFTEKAAQAEERDHKDAPLPLEMPESKRIRDYII
jgi:hypothetical protein